MKLQLGLVVVTLSTLALLGCNKANLETKLDTDQQKAGYAIGQQIGRNLKTQAVDIDVVSLAMGINDAKSGKESRMKPEEMQTAMQKLQESAMKKMSEEGENNKKSGQDFLDKNKARPGVKVTASGLQYEVVKEGEGKSPNEKDTVSVHYTGTLTNGEKFDSSVDRGEPAEFPVDGVIPGWTEALKMMKPGAKWKLVIPSDLAYGPMGRPGIPPNSVLQFDVELMGIKTAKAEAPAKAGKAKK